MKRDEPSAVKSLDRGLDILEYLASAEQPPSFSRLLADLGIPRSSLFHLLNNLQARDFITRDPATDGYRLGSYISKLARAAPRPTFRERVLPSLTDLSNELNETCGFYVRVQNSVEVIASAISTQALSYTMKVGARAPLYAVSAGKIVLAEFSAAALKEYVANVELVSVTPHTIRSKARLMQELQAVRSTGFAYSREEFTPGITAIATAVKLDGQFVGALNIAVPTVRFASARAAVFKESLRITAQAIAVALE